MMSTEQKVNQHPESSAAGFEHAIPICGDNHKKVSQNSDGAFDSASLGEAFAARFPRSSSRTLAKRFVMPLC